MKRFTLLILIFIALGLTIHPLSAENLGGLDNAIKTESIDGNAAGSGSAKAPAAPDARMIHALQNTTYVVLRAEPKLASAPVAVLPADVKFELLERLDAWVKVRCPQGTGYIREIYFKDNSPRTRSGNTAGTPTTGNPTQDTDQPAANVPSGSLKAENFGFDKRYQPVYDLVEKFVQSNQKYLWAGGHKWKDGYDGNTDCSGFTGSFYQKLAAASGVAPAFPKNSWYPASWIYKTKYTKKLTNGFPPPDPRDLIRPGDIFVMGDQGNGHIGVFMGYDKSGNPLIAHSTPRKVDPKVTVSGKNGYSGVRIEVLPSRYRSSWKGMYRIDGTDQMLDKLAGS